MYWGYLGGSVFDPVRHYKAHLFVNNESSLLKLKPQGTLSKVYRGMSHS